jgi:hypothetical protein
MLMAHRRSPIGEHGVAVCLWSSDGQRALILGRALCTGKSNRNGGLYSDFFEVGVAAACLEMKIE